MAKRFASWDMDDKGGGHVGKKGKSEQRVFNVRRLISGLASKEVRQSLSLNLLILMDAPTFSGCVVKARLIGVIEAEQKEKGGDKERNDRLIAVAVQSRRHERVRSLKELPEELLREIEHFFISYNELKGKEFMPLGRFGPKRALKLLKQGIRSKKKGRR